MKTLKKSLAMLLALVMSLGCMSVGAWATDEIIDDASIATAIESAASGDVIDVPAGNYQIAATIVIPAGVTIKGAGSDKTTLTITTTNGDGVKITNPNVMISDMTIDGSNITSSGYNSLINVEAGGVVIEDVIMTGGGRSTWNSSILVETLSADKTFTVKNSTISGSFRGVLRESCDANIVIEDCDIDAVYPFNINGGNSGDGTVTVTGGTLHGWTSYSTVDHVTFTNVAFSKGNSGYDCVAAYVDTTFTNCSFDEEFDAYARVSPFTWKFLGCEKNGAPLTKDNFTSQFTDSDVWMKCTLIVDDAMYVKTGDESGEWRTIVAQIGNEYYTSLADAIAAAKDGDTIKVLDDIVLTDTIKLPAKKLVFDGLKSDGSKAVISFSTANKAEFRFNESGADVTFKNLAMKHSSMGSWSNNILVGVGANVTITLDSCELTAVYYSFAVYPTGTVNAKINHSTLSGYAALYLYGARNCMIQAENSTFNGYNEWNKSAWNDFGVIVIQDYNYDLNGENPVVPKENTLTLTNCAVNDFDENTNAEDPYAIDTADTTNEIIVSGTNAKTYVGINSKLASGKGLSITGGTFNKDPSAYVADGYAAVANKPSEGLWTVGPVSSASTEIITTGKDTYTVTTTVKESEKATAAVLSESSASVSVASITKEAITADDTLDTKTTDTVSLANVKTKNVAETAAAMAVAAGATEATDINVTIKLEKQDDTEAQRDNLEDIFGSAQEVFEVHPVATYTATKTVGGAVQTIKTETFTIANDDLEGSFTFKLYLDSGKYGTGDNALKAGDLVTVTHYKDGGGTEIWTKKVQSDNNGLFVELTLSSFSHVAVKAAAAGATVDYTVKIADATSGTAVIYPGDSVTMDVTVSGDDFYGGDFTIEYDNTAFDLGEQSFATGINPLENHRTGWDTGKPTDKAWVNYNLVKDGARLADGSKLFSVTFTAKSGLTGTKTYDFKVVDARVNYDNTKNADIVDCTENSTFVTNDTVKVNATKFTVTFDGVSRDWEYSVYEGKGVDTIPTDVQTGYTFKGWALTNTATTALTADAIRNAAVTAAVTYYPVFEAEQYNVTLTGTTTDAGPAKATFGQNYTATISDYDANNYDYTVTYKAGDTASKTITPTGASITIPAEDITGALAVTVEKTLKGFEVELHADYVTGYTLVLVKAASGNTTNPIYTYDNGPMFFVNELTKDDQSKAYGAYAILVEGAITQSAARAKVGINTTTTAAETLTIQKDVNATGRIDSSDLQAAFSGYKVQLTLPEQMAIYLRADVNGDYKLDTADVGRVNSARTE